MQGFRVRNSLVGKPKIANRNVSECPPRAIQLTSVTHSSSKIIDLQPIKIKATNNVFQNSKPTRTASLIASNRGLNKVSSINSTPRSGSAYQFVKTDFLSNSTAFRRGVFIENRLKPTKSVRFHSSSATSDVTTPFPEYSYHTPKSVDKYRRFKDGTDGDKRNFTYFMASGFRFALVSGARLAVLQFVYAISPSRSVLALASIEVDVSSIAEGKTVTLKWRGKPVFIRHRTPEDIQNENSVDVATLRDPQKDAERYREPTRPEIVVLLGVCTHLGCVPLTDAGEIPGGFFCPCHGSHYDTVGRIRKGPAPKNLEIPTYKFVNDSTVLIG